MESNTQIFILLIIIFALVTLIYLGIIEKLVIFMEEKPVVSNKYFRIMSLLVIIFLIFLYLEVDISLAYLLVFVLAFVSCVVIYAIFVSKINDLIIKISQHKFFSNKRNQYILITTMLTIILLNLKDILLFIDKISAVIAIFIIAISLGLFTMFFYWNYANIIEEIVMRKTDSKYEEKIKEDTEKHFQEYMKSQ